jgi:hypothetical protein
VDRSQIKNRQIAMQTLKARIYRQQLEAQVAATQAARKQQVLFILILPHLLIIYKNCCCLHTICYMYICPNSILVVKDNEED